MKNTHPRAHTRTHTVYFSRKHPKLHLNTAVFFNLCGPLQLSFIPFMAVQRTTNQDSISVTHRFRRLTLWLCVLIAETVDVWFKTFWALTSFKHRWMEATSISYMSVNHVLLQINKTGVQLQNIVNSSSSCFLFSLMTNFLAVMVGVGLLKKLFPSKFLLKC